MPATTIPCPACNGLNSCTACRQEECSPTRHELCQLCAGAGELDLQELTAEQARAVAVELEPSGLMGPEHIRQHLRDAAEERRQAAYARGPRTRSLTPGQIEQPHKPGITLERLYWSNDGSTPARYRVLRAGSRVELAGPEAVEALAEHVAYLTAKGKAPAIAAGELLWRVRELTSLHALQETNVRHLLAKLEEAEASKPLATEAIARADELERRLDIASAVRCEEVARG